MSPFLQAGPALAFLLNCNLTVTAGQNAGYSTPCSAAETGSTEVSAIVGVGLDVGRLSVVARYELGLARIDYQDVKNRAVGFLAAYRFRLSTW